MSSNIYENLQQLGGQTALPDSPETAVLERVENPQAGTAYAVRFTAPEFTSLCPMTGQPDFAHLVIDYVPTAWLVDKVTEDRWFEARVLPQLHVLLWGNKRGV